MDENPDSELKRIKNKRARFIEDHLGSDIISKIKEAQEYGILVIAHGSNSFQFTDEFIKYLYDRIVSKDPVIQNDIESLRFKYHKESILFYSSNPDKERFQETIESILEAPYELWERIKVLIPIISEAMQNWILTKKKEKLKRMTEIPDNNGENSKPIIKYKITRIEINPDESDKNEIESD